MISLDFERGGRFVGIEVLDARASLTLELPATAEGAIEFDSRGLRLLFSHNGAGAHPA